MPEMNPGICQNIAKKYARKIARFPLCHLVLKLQSLWLQREVTRTKARLRPTVPKIYEADGGGAIRYQQILNCCVAGGPHTYGTQLYFLAALLGD